MEQKAAVKVVYNKESIVINVEHGSNLFSVVKHLIPSFGAACNGNGTCGKCRVRITSGNPSDISKPAETEFSILGTENLDKGWRLACITQVFGEVDVEISGTETEAEIVSDSIFKLPTPCHAIFRKEIFVAQPSMSDQRSDLARLYNSISASLLTEEGKVLSISQAALRRLAAALRQENGHITATIQDAEITAVFAGNTADATFGIAVDIGTTTLASCLIDLKSGKVLSAFSKLNGQKTYGLDIISRIKHTMDYAEGSSQLRRSIVEDLSDIGAQLCKIAGVEKEMVDAWVLTGNTAMGHFLMGWPGAALASAPFIPVSVAELKVSAQQIDLHEFEASRVILLSGVSAYVGADTVSALLACDFHLMEKQALLVDLGTNGELVLGDKNSMTACSTAAGPVFEGAGMRCGMGAVKGAIDSVYKKGVNEKNEAEGEVNSYGCICWTTLGAKSPLGICGTGILDAISFLLEEGLIDETGRMLRRGELSNSLGKETSELFLEHLIELEGQPAFLLVPEQFTGHGRDIVITQRDVREFQNAKAAVAAGIATLSDVAGIALNEVEVVFLAGGLGTRLNPKSAIKTGLLPAELSGKILAVGNAALAGAMQCLISVERLHLSQKIASEIRFIELSGMKAFSDRYMDAMFFE